MEELSLPHGHDTESDDHMPEPYRSAVRGLAITGGGSTGATAGGGTGAALGFAILGPIGAGLGFMVGFVFGGVSGAVAGDRATRGL